MTLSDRFKSEVQRQAELVLSVFDFNDDEINSIVEDWCSYDFEIGQVTRCLAKLQRIAFEHSVKKDGAWDVYKRQFKDRDPLPGFALQEQG